MTDQKILDLPIPADLPKGTARLLENSLAIWGEDALSANQVGFVHTLHANCYLPRKQLAADEYVQRNGPFSLLLESGKLLDPVSAEWVRQPLPFGGKPRALLAYISTQAKLTGSPEVEIGRSFTDFVRLMSNEASGGAKGSLGLWKRQLMALAASSMRIGFAGDGATRVKKIEITDEIEVWFATEPNQTSIFPSVVRLSPQYFELLREHAMPVDMRALRALQGDPLAFDIYTWLAYRLCRIRKPSGQLLTWAMLHEQFGSNYKLVRQFKPRFVKALRKALSCYPDARLEEARDGIVLKSSPAPIRDGRGQLFKLTSDS